MISYRNILDDNEYRYSIFSNFILLDQGLTLNFTFRVILEF